MRTIFRCGLHLLENDHPFLRTQVAEPFAALGAAFRPHIPSGGTIQGKRAKNDAEPEGSIELGCKLTSVYDFLSGSIQYFRISFSRCIPG